MLERDYLRRGIAELIGMFVIVFIGIGSSTYAQSATDLGLAYGLVVAVAIAAVGPGGFFNPAITLALLVTRRVSAMLAVWYWLAQFAGAALAALLLKWVLPTAAQSGRSLGTPALGAGVNAAKGVVVEAVLTFFIVWVVYALAVDPRAVLQQAAAWAIGVAVLVDSLMAFGISGAAMNPARAFGPELVGDHWKHFWVWYIGPFAGAVIAAALYELLYLRPGRPEPVGPPETGLEEPGAGDAALR